MKPPKDQSIDGGRGTRTDAFTVESALTAQASDGTQHPGDALHRRAERDTPSVGRHDGPHPNGTTLGDFVLLREIGRGGMGVVYEAMQQSLRRRVALKMLPLESLMNQQQVQRFRNESLAAAQLQHPNIVPVYSVGSDAGTHYYAMQFIEGDNLARVIASIRRGVAEAAGHNSADHVTRATGDTDTELETSQASPPKRRTIAGASQSVVANGRPGALSAEAYLAAVSSRRAPQAADYFQAVARIGIQAAEALGHAHDVSVVHRDVKPSNLMLDVSGKLWVTDFGLAQVRNADSLTRTGALVGTLRYMSPEQAAGRRAFLDHRTDIYSLGATLYELITLRRAVEGSEVEQMFRQLAFGQPVPLRRVHSRIPEDLETIIGKAMEREPADRYQTATALAEDLRRFVADEPILARPPTLLKRCRRWMSRHRAVSTAVAASLVVILLVSLVASVAIWNAWQSEKQARERAEDLLGQSEGSRLLAQAAILQPSNPRRALELAVQGAQLHPGAEANAALVAAMDANHELVNIAPRTEISSSLAISPDGQHVITCVSAAFYARGNWPALVHDMRTGRTVAELDDGTAITSAVFDPTGRVVLTTSAADRRYPRAGAPDDPLSRPPTLWDARDWRRLTTLTSACLPAAHEGVFSADGARLVLGGPDATATVYDVPGGQPLLTLRGHRGRVVFAGFSPDARWIATVAEDDTVAVWDALTGRQQWSFPVRDRTLRSPTLFFTSDGQHLVVSDGAGTRFLPLLASGDAATPAPAAYFAEGVASVSRGGPYAVLPAGKRLTILDTQSLTAIGRIDLEQSATNIELSDDGSQLLVACRDTMHLFAIPSAERLATFAGHTLGVVASRFAPAGDHVASLASDRTLRVWHAETGFDRRRFSEPLSLASPPLLTYSTDGRLLATASTKDWVAICCGVQQPLAVPNRWHGTIGHDHREAETLATWQEDRVEVWDVTRSRPLATLARRGLTVRAAMAIPHSRWVGLITGDGAAFLWQFDANRLVPVTAYTEAAEQIDASPDGRLVAVRIANGCCRLLDVGLQEVVAELPHDYELDLVRFNSDGTGVVTVGRSGQVRLWDIASSTPAVTVEVAIPGPGEAVCAGNNRYLVTYQPLGGKTIRCWDAASGQPQGELPTIGIVDVSGHPTKPLVSVDSDRGLQLWNLENGRVQTLTDERVRAARFSGDYVAAVSVVPLGEQTGQTSSPLMQQAGKLRVWHVASGQLVREESLDLEPYALHVVQPDPLSAGLFVVGAWSHNAPIYRFDTREPIMRVGNHAAPIVFVSFANDDASIVTASGDGTLKIHDRQGQLLDVLTAGRQPITAAALSPDRQRLVTGDEAGGLVLWDLDTAVEVRRLSGHSAAVHSVAFDAAGDRLLTTSADSTARLWDLRTGQTHVASFRHGVFAADLAPDGKTLMIVPGDATMRGRDGALREPREADQPAPESIPNAILIDLATQRTTSLDQHGSTILGRFSPQGRRLGLLSFQQTAGTLEIYDLASGQRIRRIESPSKRISAFGFDDHARRVVTRQTDRLTVWDIQTGQPQLDVPVEAMRTAMPWRVRDWEPFSPDGQWIVTPDDDGRVTKWPVAPLDMARATLLRPTAERVSNGGLAGQPR